MTKERIETQRLEIPNALMQVSIELNSQDNLATSDPVFMVQKKVRGTVPSGHSDSFVWLDEDYDEVDGETAARLNELDDAIVLLSTSDQDFLDSHDKSYFVDRWENVQPFFTRKGAEDYIAINGHNVAGRFPIKEGVRIYVESGWRNHEWQEIRTFLMSLTPKPESDNDNN